MSMDTVDDLQAAEDTAGLFASILAELLDVLDRAAILPGPAGLETISLTTENLAELRNRARAVLDAQANACRPTCGWEYDDDRDRWDEDEPCEFYGDGTPACGCPCNHGHPDRVHRLRHLVAEYEHRGHAAGHVASCTEGCRYLLIEENVRGGFWLTTFDTAEAAAEYHAGQEYASEWTATELLVDLDDGREFRPGPVAFGWVPETDDERPTQ